MALNGSEASILEEGVFFLEDSDIGRRVNEFDKKGFPFQTEEGLDFCRTNTLEDKRVRAIIESFFKRSSLGLLKAYGPRRDTVFSFLNNPWNEPTEITDETNKGKHRVKVLIVQLLPRNSVMVFYGRSHLQSLRARSAKIGLLEVPQESLEREDIKALEVTMKEGGFAIIDGRLGFKMVQGDIVMVGFAVEEELQYWSKMRLPKRTELIRKIEDMQSESIGMNVEFINLGLESDSIASTAQPQ